MVKCSSKRDVPFPIVDGRGDQEHRSEQIANRPGYSAGNGTCQATSPAKRGSL